MSEPADSPHHGNGHGHAVAVHGEDGRSTPVKSPTSSRKTKDDERKDDTDKQDGKGKQDETADGKDGKKKDVAAEETGSPQGYIEFVKQLRKVWVDQPEVLVSWKDLSYILSIDKQETAVHNVFATFVNGLKAPIDNLTGRGRYTLNALQPSSGMILPASTTLVLAPPGHGKSLFLKALSVAFEPRLPAEG